MIYITVIIIFAITNLNNLPWSLNGHFIMAREPRRYVFDLKYATEDKYSQLF